MSDLLLWGAGGHGKVIVDVARSTGLFRSILFIDDDRAKAGTMFYGCPVLGGPEKLHELAGYPFAVTIGDNRTRARCFMRARASSLVPVALIDRRASVSASAVIGAGTVLIPGVVINADAAIGENCIINTGASVGHDSKIADHVHIGPHATLGGGCRAGLYAHIAMGALILPGVEVGEEAVAGAGAVVLHNVPARTTVVGVPAKALVRNRRTLEVSGSGVSTQPA